MKKIRYILTAMLAMALPGKAVLADTGDIINIKFGGSPFYSNGAAINDVTGQYWNSFASTDQDDWAELSYSTGNVTTASIQYDMTGTKGLDASGTAFPNGNIDKALVRGFVSTDNINKGVIRIQGLETATYDLYVYSQIDKNLTSHLNFTANGVTGALTNNGGLTELIQGHNWLKSSVAVNSSGLLTIALDVNSQINGVQIVQTSSEISVVPEPGAIALLGTGCLFILRSRKMKDGYSNEAVAHS